MSVCNNGVLAGADSHDFAASRIAQQITRRVLFGAGAVSSSQLLSGFQHAERVTFMPDFTALLQFAMDQQVQFMAGSVIGRNHQRALTNRA